MFKKLALSIAAVFVLYGAVGTARLLVYPDIANFLDAQAASFSAQYHAAKAEQAVKDAAEAVAEISPTTVQ
ncbi:UNVERIFIED_ORG: hypothetical protein LHK14_02050 [Roseateles sp. XES5]|nr:hypothetical protein [Roseateles sp. XES5]